MAPLPVSNTARAFFDYVTGTGPTATNHTMMWRFNDGDVGALDDLQNKFAAFLNDLGPEMFWTGWAVTGVRFSPTGENFSIPIPMTGALDLFVGDNDTAHTQRDETNEFVWSGRSLTTGRRVDFSLYGLAAAPSPTFRYTSDDGILGADLVASIDVLESAPLAGPFVIDGSVPVWYQYVNVQQNSYWERRKRS